MEMERVFFGQWNRFETFIDNIGGTITYIVGQNKFPAIFIN